MGDAINIDRADDVGDDDDDVNDPVKVKVRGMMARLTSVHCVRKEQMNLLKFVQTTSHIKTKELNSRSCPLFANGVNINLAPEKDKRQPVTGEAKKSLPNAFARMTGNAEPKDVLYLEWTEKPDPKFDDQVRKKLYELARESEVGYFNNDNRECLKKNVYDLGNILIRR